METLAATEFDQLAASLSIVRSEIDQSLEHATGLLEQISNDFDTLKIGQFQQEMVQLKGTFKLLDFRAGERLCEEIASVAAKQLKEVVEVPDSILEKLTSSLSQLKHYLDLVTNSQGVAPSLLVPTINTLRKINNQPTLTEASFFVVNLRPRLVQSAPLTKDFNLPVRRVRQMFQLGVLGVLGGNYSSAVNIIVHSLAYVEKAARNTASWPFWQVAIAAAGALAQPSFEKLPMRLSLLLQIDRQLKRLDVNGAHALHEKVADAFLKDLLYWVAIAEPQTNDIKAVQDQFQICNTVKEKNLRNARQLLNGSSVSAVESAVNELLIIINTIQDDIDRGQRNPTLMPPIQSFLDRLTAVADTLLVLDAADQHKLAMGIIRGLEQERCINDSMADNLIRLEYSAKALITKIGNSQDEIDPTTLAEAKVVAKSEAVANLAMVKRSIGAFLDTNDPLHVKNVCSQIHEVSGVVSLLGKEVLRPVLLELEQFIDEQLVSGSVTVDTNKLQAFAECLTALEYYFDNGNMAAEQTSVMQIILASLKQLRGS